MEGTERLEYPVSQDDQNLLIQGVVVQLEEQGQKLAALSARVFAGASVSSGSSSVGGLKLLSAPALIVNGTNVAHVAPVVVDLSSSVPATASGVLVSVDTAVEGGTGGMILSAVYPGGGSAVVLSQHLSGADVFINAGFGVVPIANQQLLYTVTDESGGSTSGTWTRYKVYLVGYF